MVKRLRFCWVAIKRMVLISAIVLLGLGFWLHAGERSLSMVKPWIESAVNSSDAPYTIAIGNVTVDWTNAALLGKLHVTNVSFAKRDGNVFAQLPEVYVTIDPIGFLPTRRLLHKVILHQPRMFAARNAQGVVEFGLEGAPERIGFSELVQFFVGNKPDAATPAPGPLSLPFHDFIIDHASLTFTDEVTGTNIVSTPFDFHIGRRRHTYEAVMNMPFTVDDEPVGVTAEFRAQPQGEGHVASVVLSKFPAKLLCMFDTCPAKVSTGGVLSGTLSTVVADDFSLHAFHAAMSAPRATLTAPQWFAEPLTFTKATMVLEGDVAKHEVALMQSTLPLADTTITATANIHKAEDGWYATADAETTRLDVDKIYKYWPLFMAPDSRTWVTSKMKAGYAAKGTLKLNITPADLAAEYLPEKAVDAVADARDITFEYLPGFPMVEHMDGIAHFTGTTVRVEGSTGSLLSGTKISHAMLWCPELNSAKNPMEAEVTLTAPAADAATMLALKYFTFDDALGLDAKTIKGTVDTTMKLKFNAFSEQKQTDPNEIHLENVDYDVAATMHDVAQEKLYGSYNAKAINGTLKANTSGMNFSGDVTLGDAGTSNVTLSQPSGKALTVNVKGVAASAPKAVASHNDFTLTYLSDAVPSITLRGACVDASASYGSKGNSLLANFPAMKLDINVDQLLLTHDMPFRNVVGTLNCSAARCESANFTAKTDKSTIKAGIQTIAGTRQFLMTSRDAGNMLKGFDITDRMTGGNFELRGQYNDRTTPPQLDAKLRIDEFTLKNSQILGRIFSIGSLTGLQNALTGSGISFDKMTANMNSRAGVITVTKGIASGTSIGITVDGTVNTTNTVLSLKGVVVPAYALNSLLGKIPIIGMIAGGDEGLIAFNYSVKGTYDKPDVGVNPLSGLTPGFLRGIFGIFDDKTPSQPSDHGDAADKSTKSKPVGLNQPSNVHKH